MYTKNALLLTCVLLHGCFKSEPLQNNNIAPFTVAGFTLGNTVSASFKQDHPELYCKTEKKDVLSCFRTMTGMNQGFFSKPLDSLTVEIDLTSLKIRKINALVDLDGNKELAKFDVERTWRLQGRCLTADDYENAVRYDSEKTRYFDQIITEALLSPQGADLVCLSTDGHLFKYDGQTGDERWVEAYYLAEQYVTAFRYIFAAYGEYKAANGLS